jgi:hypothetical protein
LNLAIVRLRQTRGAELNEGVPWNRCVSFPTTSF